MILNPPFQISPRLLPALCIRSNHDQACAWISIEEWALTTDGRVRYRYYIDLPDGTEHSGVGGGTLQEGMASLLSFLRACAESWRYKARDGGKGENADLFPPAIAEWASQHIDELGLLQCELEQSEETLIEL